jgi:hypothetical protein
MAIWTKCVENKDDNWEIVATVQTQIILYCFKTVKKGKVKAIPVQAWTGPEVFRRLRLPDCYTIGT